MVRIQIQLTEEQSRFLKKLSAEREASIAELIRQAVDLLAQSVHKPNQSEIRQRALAAVGKYGSKRSDISRNHDKYLAEYCL